MLNANVVASSEVFPWVEFAIFLEMLFLASWASSDICPRGGKPQILLLKHWEGLCGQKLAYNTMGIEKLTFNKGALSHFIPQPGPVPHTSWHFTFYFIIKILEFWGYFHYLNIISTLDARGQSVRLAMICWKMPGTAQSTLLIFQVVNLPICQAAGNTLINSEGRSKLPYFKDCYRLLLGFTTLFNILGHQRRFRHRAWKVQ